MGVSWTELGAPGMGSSETIGDGSRLLEVVREAKRMREGAADEADVLVDW